MVERHNEMKPTPKTTYWWYLDTDGESQIAPISCDEDKEFIEEGSDFVRWIGEVDPPTMCETRTVLCFGDEEYDLKS